MITRDSVHVCARLLLRFHKIMEQNITRPELQKARMPAKTFKLVSKVRFKVAASWYKSTGESGASHNSTRCAPFRMFIFFTAQHHFPQVWAAKAPFARPPYPGIPLLKILLLWGRQKQGQNSLFEGKPRQQNGSLLIQNLLIKRGARRDDSHDFSLQIPGKLGSKLVRQ